MAKKPLNIGIVGYGFMGRTHANGYHNAAKFFDTPLVPVLKAACGRDAAKVKAYADNWGFQSTETDDTPASDCTSALNTRISPYPRMRPYAS